jgi:hypothetical protein
MSRRPVIRPLVLLAWAAGALQALAACSSGGGTNQGTSTGNPVVAEDVSASGTAAGAVGGALSSSGGSGTLASAGRPHAESLIARLGWALFPPAAASAGYCPTYAAAEGSGCHASGDTMWLDYASCNFRGSLASWEGVVALTSTAAASCGTYPAPGANGSLIRQAVSASASTAPATATITNAFGFVTEIDDQTANLANFNSDAITTLANGGYGSKIGFAADGTRNSATVAHRIVSAGRYDHSVSGSVTVSEVGGSGRRAIGGGPIFVYHNLLRIIGTSTFSNVVHSDLCCLPISGSVATTFSQGSVQPTAAGALAVGKTERLTFTGCGTATLQSYDGTTSSVSLTRCF